MDIYTLRKLLGTNRELGDAVLDQFTGAVPVIDCLTRQIYRGNIWMFAHRVPDVASQATINIHMHTAPKPAILHNVKFWTDASYAEADFIRAPEAITPGTALGIYRVNHLVDLPVPAGLAVFADSQGISGGTVCPCSYLGGGSALAIGTRTDAETRDIPVLLSPDTDYIIRLKNLNGEARHFSIQVFLCVEQDDE